MSRCRSWNGSELLSLFYEARIGCGLEVETQRRGLLLLAAGHAGKLIDAMGEIVNDGHVIKVVVLAEVPGVLVMSIAASLAATKQAAARLLDAS
ncbi:MAG: hypothetical protein ABI200_02145 [Gaiellales bacterium]